MTIVADDFTEVIPLFGIPLDKLPKYRREPLIGTKRIERRATVDVKLLFEILEFIEAHPTTWKQEDWFKIVDRQSGDVKFVSETSEVSEVNSCGASFCFAGHVALATGFPEPPKDDNESWTREVENGWDEYVQDYAAKRIGLSENNADVLFHETNSMLDLRHMVTLISIFGNRIDYYDLREVRHMEEDEFQKTLQRYLVQYAK